MEHLLRATAEAETRHFWFRGFRSFVTPLLDSAMSGQSDARLLDCGCGTGANLELLSRFGRAFGFDLSETGLRLGRQAGRMYLARASVDAAPFPAGRFDLVTSFDVLYSLDDTAERSAIAEMFRMLKPGGFVVINVAAMRALRGDHSVLSREFGATIAKISASNCRPPVSRSSASPTPTRRCFFRWRSSGDSSVAAA